MKLASTLLYGVFAPEKTLQQQVSHLNELLSNALADPALIKTLDAHGLFPHYRYAKKVEFRIGHCRKAWGEAARSLQLLPD